MAVVGGSGRGSVVQAPRSVSTLSRTPMTQEVAEARIESRDVDVISGHSAKRGEEGTSTCCCEGSAP